MVYFSNLFSVVFCNLYGQETNIDNLVKQPLSISETLMQDGRGCFHRVRISEKSAIIQRIMFWVQCHLNKREYLDAIPNLLRSFEERAIERVKAIEWDEKNRSTDRVNPILTEVWQQADQLISNLQNDYRFTYFEENQNLKADIQAIKQSIQEQLELSRYDYLLAPNKKSMPTKETFKSKMDGLVERVSDPGVKDNIHLLLQQSGSDESFKKAFNQAVKVITDILTELSRLWKEELAEIEALTSCSLKKNEIFAIRQNNLMNVILVLNSKLELLKFNVIYNQKRIQSPRKEFVPEHALNTVTNLLSQLENFYKNED